jgi:hypothetical protein
LQVDAIIFTESTSIFLTTKAKSFSLSPTAPAVPTLAGTSDPVKGIRHIERAGVQHYKGIDGGAGLVVRGDAGEIALHQTATGETPAPHGVVDRRDGGFLHEKRIALPRGRGSGKAQKECAGQEVRGPGRLEMGSRHDRGRPAQWVSVTIIPPR